MKNFFSIKSIYYVVFAIMCFISAETLLGKSRTVNTETTEKLWNQLKNIKNSSDSVKILYDIYDLTSASKSTIAGRKENEQVLDMIYSAALNAGDTASALNAIRILVTIARYDIPFINSQQKRISSLPESIEKKETEAYLNLQRHVYATRDTTISSEKRQQNFHKLTLQLDKIKNSKDMYDRMNFDFALMLYGANLIRPKQLNGYMTELNRLVEQTRSEGYPIKFLFYTTAPIIYDDNQEWEKAVEADRRLLKLLDKLEAEARKDNRLYLNYDRERFTAYRRMLSNFNILPKGEPERIYNELQNLINKLPDDQITTIDRLAIEASWNMYQHNYEKALQLLRGVLSSKRFLNKPKYIMLYINAAASTGSYEDLQRGQDMYIELIKKRAEDASDTEYNRMRVALDIDQLEASNEEAMNVATGAEIEVDKAIHEKDMFILIAIIIIFISMLIILAVQFVAYRRNRRTALKLKETNLELINERDSLKKTKNELEAARDRATQAIRQKTEFIHNVSHEISEPAKAIAGFSQLIVDSVPEEKRKYLEGFVDIINHNSDILQRIVGDILSTAEVDGVITNVTVTHFSPENICHLAADNFRPRLNSGQQLIVEPMIVKGETSDKDPGIDSDASRLEQILLNVIGNAVKFCDKGKIIVSPILDFDSKTLSIAVTDEGPGIPKDQEEKIFGRFEKLGQYNDGLGLGLYVSREIAHMLGGEIKVDTTYTNGARFLIELPISIRSNSY